MCGIFGVICAENSGFPERSLRKTVDRLFKFSESRGKEASGMAVQTGEAIRVLKAPVSASALLRMKEYSHVLEGIGAAAGGAKTDTLSKAFAVIGHSRLVTHGGSETNMNNQPVVKDGAVGIHNGIIANDRDLWQQFPGLKRTSDVDTEVLLALLQMFRRMGHSPDAAAAEAFRHIRGSASVAVLFDDVGTVLLATNTGSLYVCSSGHGKVMLFASERYILERVLPTLPAVAELAIAGITQIKAWTGLNVDLISAKTEAFSLQESPGISDKCHCEERSDEAIRHDSQFSADLGTGDANGGKGKIPVHQVSVASIANVHQNGHHSLTQETRQSMLALWERIHSGEAKIRRCSRCLLPETMPYISFDPEGVCNFCRQYEKKGSRTLKSEAALEEVLSKYRSNNGTPDCIVGFSGGRDSAFGLDYVRSELKMNPIAFTYDWGMVTDVGRRNQARVCGELGVEHILVSADIKRKRENIRKNLIAWLKKPDLGMLPILMAGDKKFYYYFHKIRKQTGARLFIFAGGHELEETPFKYGFCGIDHGVDKAQECLTQISTKDKVKLLSYYAGHYLTNRAYINSSIYDTLLAYYCTYMLPDDYLYLFHYIEWDEEKLVSRIRRKFDWEAAPDTIATWRLDDGTVPFYNYIYMARAGFTEFDYFRSGQIRQGKLTREQAFDLVKEENKPWFEEIEWYGNALGVDMNEAIRVVHSASRLYGENTNHLLSGSR